MAADGLLVPATPKHATPYWLCIRTRGVGYHLELRGPGGLWLEIRTTSMGRHGTLREAAQLMSLFRPDLISMEGDLPELHFTAEAMEDWRMSESTGGALALQQKAAGVRDLMTRCKDQIAMALPKHMTPERMFRVAMTAVQKTPRLLDCDPKSLIAAVIQASQLGLEPDGILGASYLVPYWNKKTGIYECQLIPGYRGLMDLARRSGYVSTIYAECVYASDDFRVTYGLDKTLVHRPKIDGSDRGQFVGAYAVAKLRDGTKEFCYLAATDIDAIRKRSQSANNGPWVTDFGEMAKKTAIRRLCKTLPRSVEYRDSPHLDALAKAVDIQEAAELGEAIDLSGVLQLEPPTTAPTAAKQEAPDTADVAMDEYQHAIPQAATIDDAEGYYAHAAANPTLKGRDDMLAIVRAMVDVRKAELAK